MKIIEMATLLKLVYLIVCFVVANGMPKNTFKNAVSQTSVDNSGLVNIVSHGQFTTYTSYGGFADFNFGDLQYRLNSILANMLQSLKLNFPVILINPRNVFGPYFPPGLVATHEQPNSDRTSMHFPITERFDKPTPRYTVASPDRPTNGLIPNSKMTPAGASSIKPTVEWTPTLSSRGAEVDASESTTPETTTVEDDYDDYTRPIVLRGLNSFENEVLDSTSRPAPNVEHGSLQAGS